MDKEPYPISAYDRYLCLKMTPLIWFMIVFLARPYLVMVLSVARRRGDKMAIIDMFYPDRITLVLGGLAAIPALFVLYSYIKRRPGTEGFARKLWHLGVPLLAVASILNVFVVLFPLLAGDARSLVSTDWVQIGICGYFLYELYTSARIKDTFADYPKPEDAEKE